MNRKLSGRCLWCTAVLALFNSTFIRSRSAAGQDAWAAVLLSTLVTAAMAALYAQMHRKYPGMTLFGMLRASRSAVTAKLLTICWMIIGFGCAVRTVQSYGEFVQSCVLPQTPHFIMMGALLGCCLVFASRGVHVLGRWSGVVFPMAAALWLVLMGMSVQHYELSRLMPSLRDAESLAEGTLSLIAFPGGELIFLTSLFADWENGPGRPGDERRLWLWIIAGTGLLQLVTFTANVLVLSADIARRLSYATYFMTSVIGVGDFFRHVEVLSAFLSQITVIVNIGVVQIFLCQGLEELWGSGAVGNFAFPTALVIYGLSGCVSYAAAQQLSAAVGMLRLLPAAAGVLTAVCILCPSRKIRI